MKYYQEITLLPDSEISLGFLWQKLYQQIHLALVAQKIDEQRSAIAVGFPNYRQHRFPLGNKLRLFASTEAQLAELNTEQWLARLTDYVHIKSIQAVPDNASAVCFVRKHVKGQARIDKDQQAKAQRWAAQSGQSLEQCLQELEKSRPQPNQSLPFIWLESLGARTEQGGSRVRFPFYIDRVEVNQPQKGDYSCYGLSVSQGKACQLATVPHF